MENGITLYDRIVKDFGEGVTELKAMSPLTMAFLGDALYLTVVATVVVNQGNTANEKLHKKTEKYVSARAQAQAVNRLQRLGVLTHEEKDILRRGINAKPRSMAKNATHSEYHKATGMEALVGYLYLAGRQDRMVDLIRLGMGLGPEPEETGAPEE